MSLKEEIGEIEREQFERQYENEVRQELMDEHKRGWHDMVKPGFGYAHNGVTKIVCPLCEKGD